MIARSEVHSTPRARPEEPWRGSAQVLGVGPAAELARVLAANETTDTERIATIHVEELPEGVHLATPDDIPGLVAQGRTMAKTLEIAKTGWAAVDAPE